MRFNIETKEIDKLRMEVTKIPAEVLQIGKMIIKKNAFQLEGTMKNKIRFNKSVVTSRLMGSINTTISNGGRRAEVGTNVKYAKWVEEGRGAIRPVRAKMLRFKLKSGKVVFTKYASPSKPKPFLRPSFIEQVKIFKTDMKKLVE